MHDLGNFMEALHIRYSGFRVERERLYCYKQCCPEGSVAQLFM